MLVKLVGLALVLVASSAAAAPPASGGYFEEIPSTEPPPVPPVPPPPTPPAASPPVTRAIPTAAAVASTAHDWDRTQVHVEAQFAWRNLFGDDYMGGIGRLVLGGGSDRGGYGFVFEYFGSAPRNGVRIHQFSTGMSFEVALPWRFRVQIKPRFGLFGVTRTIHRPSPLMLTPPPPWRDSLWSVSFGGELSLVLDLVRSTRHALYLFADAGIEAFPCDRCALGLFDVMPILGAGAGYRY
jgi:hypothetical protein